MHAVVRVEGRLVAEEGHAPFLRPEVLAVHRRVDFLDRSRPRDRVAREEAGEGLRKPLPSIGLVALKVSLFKSLGRRRDSSQWCQTPVPDHGGGRQADETRAFAGDESVQVGARLHPVIRIQSIEEPEVMIAVDPSGQDHVRLALPDPPDGLTDCGQAAGPSAELAAALG